MVLEKKPCKCVHLTYIIAVMLHHGFDGTQSQLCT